MPCPEPDRDVAAILGLEAGAFDVAAASPRATGRPPLLRAVAAAGGASALVAVIAFMVLSRTGLHRDANAPPPERDADGGRLASVLLTPDPPAQPASTPPRQMATARETGSPLLVATAKQTSPTRLPSRVAARRSEPQVSTGSERVEGHAERPGDRAGGTKEREASTLRLARASNLRPSRVVELVDAPASSSDLTRQEPLLDLKFRQERFEAVDSIRLLRRR